MKKALSMLMPLVLLGCSTMGGTIETRFSETIVDENGTPITTEYSAVSKAGFLGELEQSNHSFDYQFGADNRITTGQQGTGQNNAGNAVLVEAIAAGISASMQTLESILLKRIDLEAAVQAARAANPTGPNIETTILELLRTPAVP